MIEALGLLGFPTTSNYIVTYIIIAILFIVYVVCLVKSSINMNKEISKESFDKKWNMSKEKKRELQDKQQAG